MVPDCLSCLARGMWFFERNCNIIALSHLNLRLWSLGVKVNQTWVLYKMLAYTRCYLESIREAMCRLVGLAMNKQMMVGTEGEWVCRISTIHEHSFAFINWCLYQSFNASLLKTLSRLILQGHILSKWYLPINVQLSSSIVYYGFW